MSVCVNCNSPTYFSFIEVVPDDDGNMPDTYDPNLDEHDNWISGMSCSSCNYTEYSGTKGLYNKASREAAIAYLKANDAGYVKSWKAEIEKDKISTARIQEIDASWHRADNLSKIVGDDYICKVCKNEIKRSVLHHLWICEEV